MKKIILTSLAAAALATALPATANAAQPRGGFLGGVVGCCFGIRAAGDFNAGQNIYFREWIRLIPFVGLVGAIMDTVDGYSGITRQDLHAEAPAYF